MGWKAGWNGMIFTTTLTIGGLPVAPESSSAAGVPPFSGPEKRFHSREEIVAAIERIHRP